MNPSGSIARRRGFCFHRMQHACHSAAKVLRSGYQMVGHAYVDDIMDTKLWSTMDKANSVDVETW